MIKRLLVLCVLIGLVLAHGFAHAGRNFSYVQTPSTATAIFDMGSLQSLSYQVSNTNNAGNIGERIYQVRFRLNTGGSLFSSTTVAPAGWTRTLTTTSITFQANSWASAIAVGGSQNFALDLALQSTSADVTEKLLDMRATYTSTTSGRFKRSGRTTQNNPGSWTLKSLAITAFEITDTLGNPITSLAAVNSFRLVMTVQNNSSVTQSGIVSSPNPPSATKTGTVTQSLTAPAAVSLTLAPAASGTITFTFSTSASDSGTIYFTALARASASVTSASASSPILTVVVCVFSASITASSICQYPGSNITLTMLITNSCPYSLSTVTPSLNPPTGPVTLVSGPTPATIATVAAGGGSATVNWVYQLNSAAASNPFTFKGIATSASPLMAAPIATSPSIKRGQFPVVVNPSDTNASSTNAEMTWTVTNGGCAPINSVAVTFPPGWTWANDAYSLVNLSAITVVESWAASGANPVTFTSPDIANRLPLNFGGDFSLVFSGTPATTGISNFTVSVTDANGITVPAIIPVTVSPFDPGGLNNVTSGIRIWREQFP